MRLPLHPIIIALVVACSILRAQDEDAAVVFLGKQLPRHLHHDDPYAIRDLWIEDVPGTGSFWLGPWVTKIQVNGIVRFYLIQGYDRFYVNAAHPDASLEDLASLSVGTEDFYGPFEGLPSDHFEIPQASLPAGVPSSGRHAEPTDNTLIWVILGTTVVLLAIVCFIVRGLRFQNQAMPKPR